MGCYGHLTRNCNQDSSSINVSALGNNGGASSNCFNKDQDAAATRPATQGPENASSEKDPASVAQSLHQGSAVVTFDGKNNEGSAYDLSQGTHGDWITVTRRKKEVPKRVNKKVLEGIKSLVDKSNSELAAKGTVQGKSEGPGAAYLKKRRHELTQSSSFHPGTVQPAKEKAVVGGKQAPSIKQPTKPLADAPGSISKDPNVKDNRGKGVLSEGQAVPPKGPANQRDKNASDSSMRKEDQSEMGHVQDVEMSIDT